jgi:hypothetical protein
MDLTNRAIWVFREPRSGSTLITNHLANCFQRFFYFIEGDEQHLFGLKDLEIDAKQRLLSTTLSGTFKPNEQDCKFLYNTHFFELTKSMKNYENPLLIRCKRKNTVEQFLSSLACSKNHLAFRNLYSTDGEKSWNRKLFEKVLDQQITIQKEDYIGFLNHKLSGDRLWDEHATPYENYTVYYEDLATGIEIPELKLSGKPFIDSTIKIPDYKEKIFTNIEDVYVWDKELNPS